MIENVLHVEDYKLLKDRFNQYVLKYPLINAVLSLVQNGYVYSNSSRNLLIVVTKSGFSLYKTLNDTEDLNVEVFNFLLRNKDIPNYIHFYEPSNSFVNYIEKYWDKYKLRKRVQYQYIDKMFNNVEDLLPQGFIMKFIQEIPLDKLSVFDLKFESKFWNSKDDFYTNAIGACILNSDDLPVAVCYSACIVDNIAEMDTCVLEKYRGLGFMKLVSLPYFNLSNQKRLIVHWDTFIENKPSFKVGANFLPDEVRTYNLLSVLLT